MLYMANKIYQCSVDSDKTFEGIKVDSMLQCLHCMSVLHSDTYRVENVTTVIRSCKKPECQKTNIRDEWISYGKA